MTTFGDLAARSSILLSDGYRTKVSELGRPGYPVLRVAEVGDGIITPSLGDHVREEYRGQIGAKLSQAGDVLLTTKGTVGRRAIVPASDTRFVYSPQLCFFRVLDQTIDNRWLYYWLGGADFWAQAVGVSQQTDMAPYVSLRDLRAIQVDLPPVAEQRAIAATLGALDDKIESNRRIVATTRDLARAYFAGFPKRSVRASSVLRPILGGTPKRDEPAFWDGEIPWASAKDIASAQGGFVLQTPKSVTAAGVKSSATKVMPSGTVVLTARGTVGALARLARPMAFNQSCYALQSDSVESSVLFISLEAAVSRIQDSGHGSVFNTVNMSTFDHIQLDLPVATDAEGTLRDLSSTVLQQLEEIERLTSLRDALLSELLSGRLRVSRRDLDFASAHASIRKTNG